MAALSSSRESDLEFEGLWQFVEQQYSSVAKQ
jgi:hypothetical protein